MQGCRLQPDQPKCSSCSFAPFLVSFAAVSQVLSLSAGSVTPFTLIAVLARFDASPEKRHKSHNGVTLHLSDTVTQLSRNIVNGTSVAVAELTAT